MNIIAISMLTFLFCMMIWFVIHTLTSDSQLEEPYEEPLTLDSHVVLNALLEAMSGLSINKDNKL